MAQSGGLLAKFISYKVAAKSPKGKPMPKYFHPMWQIQPHGGIPCDNLFQKQLENTEPRISPLKIWFLPMWQIRHQGSGPFKNYSRQCGSYWHKGKMPCKYYICQCGKYAPKGKALVNFFDPIYQIRIKRGTPWTNKSAILAATYPWKNPWKKLSDLMWQLLKHVANNR